MKTVLTLFAMVVLGFTLKSADVPEAAAYYPNVISIPLTGVGSTNIVVGTNDIAGDLYHTWYLTTTNLNGATCAIAFSGDSSNFVSWGTIANSVGTNTVSTNAVFKQGWVRYTFTGTNASGSLIYIGGR